MKCRYTSQAQKIEDERAAGDLLYANYLKRYRILNDTIRGRGSDRSGGVHDNRGRGGTTGDRSSATDVNRIVGMGFPAAHGSGATFSSMLQSGLAPAANSVGGPVDSSVSLPLAGRDSAGQPSVIFGPPYSESPQEAISSDMPEYLHLRNAKTQSTTGGIQKDLTLGAVLLPLLPGIMEIASDSSLTLLQGVIKICKLVLDSCSSYSS